ncbi:MAG: hypothetical protein KF752_09760 [Pirellulaceae bacterium]|nr:hypothetical protein [Pirellulaceae bacterium]
MKRIDLFSDLNTVNEAIRVVAARFGITVHHRNFASLSGSNDKRAWDMLQTNAVIGISNSRDFNAVIASAWLTRLRCAPFNYTGPIAIVPTPNELETTPAKWLELLGEQTVEFSEIVSVFLQMTHSEDRWPVLPDLKCRPSWAMLGEAISLHHEINNFFSRISRSFYQNGELINPNDSKIAERLRKWFCQEMNLGE